MTRDETIKVLAVMKAAYPNSYKGMSREEANGVVNVWTLQFANTPYEIVQIAVAKLISKNTFPPTISEVKQKIHGLYYEFYELTMIGNPTEEQRRKYEALMDKCHDSVTEPSLRELLASNQIMIGDGN